MPGFNSSPFQSADLGGPNKIKSARSETNRKHRWVFTLLADEAVSGLGDVAVYLQSAQRPHAVVEEAVMHHDEEQAYFAGKYHWEPVSLVFYDVRDPVNASQTIYEWFNQIINIPNAAVSLPNDYKKTSTLAMTAGDGTPVELWQMYNSWPIDVNWNDLDYTNTEIQTIDVSLKFDRAVREAAGG